MGFKAKWTVPLVNSPFLSPLGQWITSAQLAHESCWSCVCPYATGQTRTQQDISMCKIINVIYEADIADRLKKAPCHNKQKTGKVRTREWGGKLHSWKYNFIPQKIQKTRRTVMLCFSRDQMVYYCYWKPVVSGSSGHCWQRTT